MPTLTWFGTLESELSTVGDSSLHIHAHALLLLPSTAGRDYIRNDEWADRLEDGWRGTTEDAVNLCPTKLRTLRDVTIWCNYLTKAASPAYATRIQADLADSETFLAKLEAMSGVPRYFGPLSRGRTRTTTPN
jgi:hypothetical protein